MSTLTAAARLGAFAARCATDDFSKEIRDNAAFCLLDAFGLGLLARQEPTVAAISDLAPDCSAQNGTARLWTDGRRTGVATATEVNAAAVHGHFHDDSDYSSWSHPGSLIVPPAFSVAEASGADLDMVLRGIIAGYAAVDWLGAKEEVARNLISRGVRTSPTLGRIGAAVAAATVLKLDPGQAGNAVGIATSLAGGLLEPVRVGSDEWRLQNADAARGGATAALFAKRGVLGAASALEGPKGFLSAYAAMSAPPESWAHEPAPDAVVRAVAKPYATLGDNMSAAIAAQIMHDDGIDHRQISALRVTLWRPYSEYPGTGFRGPFDRTAQAMASTVFAVGAMLSKGRLDYAVNQKLREDSDILRLAKITEIEPDDIGGPEDTLIEATLFDGTKVRSHSRSAPRSLLYHDRGYAQDLFVRRAGLCDFQADRAAAFAAAIFEHIDTGEPQTPGLLLSGLMG